MAGTTINLQPQTPTLDARQLPALADLYLASTPANPNTQASYRYAIRHFVDWWTLAGPGSGYVLDPTLAAEFGDHLAGLGLAYNTRAMILGRVRQLFAWAKRGNYVDMEIRHWFRSPPGRSPRRSAPELADLVSLLEAAGRSRKPLRDRALIAVLIGTGIRRAEAAAADVGDLAINADGSGVLTVRGGKGGKPREAIFGPATGRFLVPYLDAGDPGTCTSQGSTRPLFCGPHQRRLTPKAIWRIVNESIRRAGLDDRIRGPHDLRRTFATFWTTSRAPAQLLSLQLGHDDPAMTVQYSRPNVADVAAAHVSPMEEIDANWTFVPRMSRFAG